MSLLFFLVFSLLRQNVINAATCKDCFIHSRAAYYPNSDVNGTEVGACEFGSFGATLNHGYVAAASDLYYNGVGCGACYQVRCMNQKSCSRQGVTVVITDHGAGDNTDFILSRRAFRKMAKRHDLADSLLALGVVEIEYRRVPCSYPKKNITIKIHESSNNPYYLAFIIWYQEGMKDITTVQLCENQNLACKLLDRSHGAVWAVGAPPQGALSMRMLLNDVNEEESWVKPVNDIPQDWKAGDIYDSGFQVE